MHGCLIGRVKISTVGMDVEGQNDLLSNVKHIYKSRVSDQPVSLVSFL